MLDAELSPTLDVCDHFPGHDKATVFLEETIAERGAKAVADLGGGANPLVTDAFIRKNGIDYTLVDISQEELDKAPSSYHKICVDITASSDRFASALGQARFDLIFSHMFLEHIKDPIQAHKNIFHSLKPGGVAVHMYPTPNIMPLALNRLLPESISHVLVKIAQPERDVDGHQVKFPAYYKLCGAPSPALRKTFEGLGYKLVQHTGYVGHTYYNAIPILRDVEEWLRPRVVSAGIPITSMALLILQKPA